MLLSTLFVAVVSISGNDRVAVMPLNANRLPSDVATILNELLVASVDQASPVRVISTADINAMLGVEKMKSMLGCNDVTCAAEIGGALGARYLLTGSASRLGDKLLVTLSLIDTTVPETVRRSTEEVDADENLYRKAVDRAVRNVFGAFDASRASTQTIGQSAIVDEHPTFAAAEFRWGAYLTLSYIDTHVAYESDQDPDAADVYPADSFGPGAAVSVRGALPFVGVPLRLTGGIMLVAASGAFGRFRGFSPHALADIGVELGGRYRIGLGAFAGGSAFYGKATVDELEAPDLAEYAFAFGGTAMLAAPLGASGAALAIRAALCTNPEAEDVFLTTGVGLEFDL